MRNNGFSLRVRNDRRTARVDRCVIGRHAHAMQRSPQAIVSNYVRRLAFRDFTPDRGRQSSLAILLVALHILPGCVRGARRCSPANDGQPAIYWRGVSLLRRRAFAAGDYFAFNKEVISNSL